MMIRSITQRAMPLLAKTTQITIRVAGKGNNRFFTTNIKREDTFKKVDLFYTNMKKEDAKVNLFWNLCVAGGAVGGAYGGVVGLLKGVEVGLKFPGNFLEKSVIITSLCLGGVISGAIGGTIGGVIVCATAPVVVPSVGLLKVMESTRKNKNDATS